MLFAIQNYYIPVKMFLYGGLLLLFSDIKLALLSYFY